MIKVKNVIKHGEAAKDILSHHPYISLDLESGGVDVGRFNNGNDQSLRIWKGMVVVMCVPPLIPLDDISAFINNNIETCQMSIDGSTIENSWGFLDARAKRSLRSLSKAVDEII